MHQTFVVVIGGSPPHPGVTARLPDDRFVIAADSGLDHARALGLAVDLVVGDLDSVSAQALAETEAAGVPVERHPAAKDAIDTELALDAALARGAERIVVVSGGGDRLDHLLGGLLVLVHPKLRGVVVEAWIGAASVCALQGPTTADFDGPEGAYVSLLPIGGPADGLVTSGLRYPLQNESLDPGSSRGVSNEFLGGRACVSLRSGSLLVVVPYALGGAS
ncbi:MAG TPA: thiamine diphosphokinase [Acidimicrobiales bacterium]|nr:thiamine diphosphokinase [Acidimicrobiales bacterium]